MSRTHTADSRRRALLLDARHHVFRQQLTGKHEQDRADATDWLDRYKRTMAQFKVWDSLNAEEEDAEIIEAYDAEEAAVVYAEGDRDGLNDGLYQTEQPIQVRGPDGTVATYQVQVEMQPTFRAVKSRA